MKTNHLNRRQFLERSVGTAGALLLSSYPWLRAEAAAKRTAVDQVALGKTGIKLSRCAAEGGERWWHNRRLSSVWPGSRPHARASFPAYAY